MHLFFILSCAGKLELPLSLCDSAISVRYDPLQATELLAFPDDYLREPAAESPTGYRLALSAERAPWTTELPAIFRPILDDAETRSGFARLGSVALRFSGPILAAPTEPEDSLADQGSLDSALGHWTLDTKFGNKLCP